jgi:uncharacterized repeat protein (TIGR01451 family)
MAFNCLKPVLAACALGAVLAGPARGELIFDPAHPAFTGAAVEGFPPAESPEGVLSVSLARPGVVISLSTTNQDGVFRCSNGDCNVLVRQPGTGTLIAFDPPVAAAGILVELAECRPELTFTGAAGSEQFQFPNPNAHGIFVGAANIGAISELRIEDCFSFFDDLRYVPGTPPPPTGPADLTLTKTGPGLFVGDQELSYGLGVANQGPGAAPGASVVDFLPPQATFEAGSPDPDVLAGGRLTVTRLGDLSVGASTAGQVSVRTSAFGVGVSCESVVTNVALATAASPELARDDNLSVSTARYDKSTRAGTGEICGNGLDDDCNGKADCWDGCNCFPPILPGPAGGACSLAAPPGLPPEIALGFGSCAPGGQSAAEHQCRVPRGECGEKVVPAWCCDPATYSDPANNGQLGQCDLGIPGCVPVDPNFKEAVPAVGAFGYGYARPGQEITYRLHYENVGTADAHGVEILDPLHPDLDEGTLVIGDGGRYDAARRTLRWTDPVLPPHAPRQVSFSVRLRAGAPPGTRVRNVATVVFPDAVPPSRTDTNFVEHVVEDPARLVAPLLRVAGCELGASPGARHVRLVNEGVGFAYNVTAEILDPPAAVTVSDGSATFAHPDDPDPDAFATVIPGATTDSREGVVFTTQTPGDPCPALRWRLRWTDLNGGAYSRDVQSLPDGDRDAVPDASDNCPAAYNPAQTDADGDGTGDACENRPPDCAAAVASVKHLWPPNHEWRAVTPQGVSDPDGGPVAIRITGVRQDEPVDACGEGHTAPDGKFQGSQAKVRAERKGAGNGRVYHIKFTATDAAGAACTGTVTTCVPRNQGGACVDGGPLYDSTSTH